MSGQIFYFTFGQGSAFRHRYVEIEVRAIDPYPPESTGAPRTNQSAARDIMHRHFGDRWAFVYDSPEQAGVQAHGLRRLCRIIEDWPIAYGVET